MANQQEIKQFKKDFPTVYQSLKNNFAGFRVHAYNPDYNRPHKNRILILVEVNGFNSSIIEEELENKSNLTGWKVHKLIGHASSRLRLRLEIILRKEEI